MNSNNIQYVVITLKSGRKLVFAGAAQADQDTIDNDPVAKIEFTHPVKGADS